MIGFTLCTIPYVNQQSEISAYAIHDANETPAAFFSIQILLNCGSVMIGPAIPTKKMALSINLINLLG